MKLSKSLLVEKEIGNKIFAKSIEKSKEFLNSIFDCEKIVVNEVEEFFDDLIYAIDFTFKERNLKATLSFEEQENNMLQEVLKISEVKDKKIYFEVSSFKDTKQKITNEIISFLEKEYNLNFTPLDPEDKDTNIIDIKESENILEIKFKHDDYEGYYLAKLEFKKSNSILTVKQYIEHFIYLD